MWPKILYTIIYIRLELSQLKGYGKKQRKKVKKSWLSPGIEPTAALALATSALTTELRQPSTFNLVCMKGQNLIIVIIYVHIYRI